MTSRSLLQNEIAANRVIAVYIASIVACHQYCRLEWCMPHIMHVDGTTAMYLYPEMYCPILHGWICYGLQSILTGESSSVEKYMEATQSRKAVYQDKTCLLFAVKPASPLFLDQPLEVLQVLIGQIACPRSTALYLRLVHCHCLKPFK